ncbi:MAG: acyl-CoA thioester hydrolase [Alphaproteobacteria bacterium]|jgi:acyl-CoA thioester hydrolase
MGGSGSAMDESNSSQLNPRDRASFKIWTSHTIRYNDQDPLGHVNNAVYSTFFEAGRTAFIKPMLDEITDETTTLDFVLARITIDFVQELGYPGSVDVGTRVLRLGTKSMTFSNAVFKSDTNECVAICDAVLVFFDIAKRHSVEPPPRLRAMLEASMRGD